MKYLQTLAIEAALIYVAIFGFLYFVIAIHSFIVWYWVGVLPDVYTLRSVGVLSVFFALIFNGGIQAKLKQVLKNKREKVCE